MNSIKDTEEEYLDFLNISMSTGASDGVRRGTESTLTETSQAGTEFFIHCNVMEEELLLSSARHVPVIALVYEARITEVFPKTISRFKGPR